MIDSINKTDANKEIFQVFFSIFDPSKTLSILGEFCEFSAHFLHKEKMCYYACYVVRPSIAT